MMRAMMLVALLTLSACGTVAGFGQDLSNGADTVRGWMN
jgi:predicted small secreted protein